MRASRRIVDHAAAGRRRGFAAFVVLALALHAVLLGGVDLRLGDEARSPPAEAMTVRSVAPPPASVQASPPPAAAAPALTEAAPTTPARRAAAAVATAVGPPVAALAADDAAAAKASEPAASAPAVALVDVAAESPAAASEGAVAATEASASLPEATGAAAIAGSDGEPPPVYRTRLPPPVTLAYEVRRGFLRGNGEIRWQPGSDGYALALEARVGGLVLLTQSSAGGIGAAGLMPRRFVDQRLRRSAQAANFDHDARTVTFSGPATTLPLLAGTQDRLSLFIQLAGIAAAAPERLVDGALLRIVVVGARGDAAVWSLRVAGREDVDTAAGVVHAIKLVRPARGPGDSGAEIWLDPERHHLPARASFRSGSGAPEYDLLLEAMVPAP